MTSCEVVLAYSHLANNKSKRKHTHFEQHTIFYFKLQMLYHHCQVCSSSSSSSNNIYSGKLFHFTMFFKKDLSNEHDATNDAGNFDNHNITK